MLLSIFINGIMRLLGMIRLKLYRWPSDYNCQTNYQIWRFVVSISKYGSIEFLFIHKIGVNEFIKFNWKKMSIMFNLYSRWFNVNPKIREIRWGWIYDPTS